MSQHGERMLDRNRRPANDAVAAWVGATNHKRWLRITRFIEDNYPGVFAPDDWLYGGAKHGWGLRFKKSKSFCTLIPEQGRLVVQIVLGGAEREKIEALLPELSPAVRRIYAGATTYHDGKWLAIPVDSAGVLTDIERLLTIKRRPRPNRHP